MHKTIFIAASALTLMTASAAYADADLVLTGLAGPAWLHYPNDPDGSGYALQGSANIQYNFTPEIGSQADLVVTYTNLDFTNYSTELTSLDGALHLFYRDEGNFLLGGFVQLGGDSFSYNAGDELPERTRGYVGVEGQTYFDNLTLYGQAGLMSYDLGYKGVDAFTGWFVTGEVRYFLTPNFKIAASAGLAQIKAPSSLDYEDTVTNVSTGASVEYKFDDIPVSLFGKIDYVSAKNEFFGDSSGSTRVLVGFKFGIGENTLINRDRSGVTLKPVEFNEFQARLAF